MIPTLLELFVADIEESLESKGIREVALTHIIEILILVYADDIVILTDSIVEMERILKALHEYCEINESKIDSKKTNIVIFRKEGHAHTKKYAPFYYNEEILEIVKSYVYLGTSFT